MIHYGSNGNDRLALVNQDQYSFDWFIRIYTLFDMLQIYLIRKRYFMMMANRVTEEEKKIRER